MGEAPCLRYPASVLRGHQENKRRTAATTGAAVWPTVFPADGVNFGISPFSPGVLAFSRILNDQEVLIVANTQTNGGFTGEVLIDAVLNPDQATYIMLFSNQDLPQAPGKAVTKAGGSVWIQEADGGLTRGPVRVVSVQLRPMEVQILRRQSV